MTTTIKELRKTLRGLEINEELQLGSDTVKKNEKGYSLKTKNDDSDYTRNYTFVTGYKEKEIIAIATMEGLIK